MLAPDVHAVKCRFDAINQMVEMMKKWRKLAALAFKGLWKEFKKVQKVLHRVISCKFLTPYMRSK